jgi:hypothetical protein
MKDQILELRKKGWSYNKIALSLSCAKSTIAYHCNDTTKKKHDAYAKQYSRAYNKRFRVSRVAFIRRYKALVGCVDCGIKNPIVLEFDHLDGSKKIGNISNMVDRRLSALKKEIRKCEVVCANCHRIRTEKRKNPPSQLTES